MARDVAAFHPLQDAVLVILGQGVVPRQGRRARAPRERPDRDRAAPVGPVMARAQVGAAAERPHGRRRAAARPPLGLDAAAQDRPRDGFDGGKHAVVQVDVVRAARVRDGVGIVRAPQRAVAALDAVAPRPQGRPGRAHQPRQGGHGGLEVPQKHEVRELDGDHVRVRRHVVARVPRVHARVVGPGGGHVAVERVQRHERRRGRIGRRAAAKPRPRPVDVAPGDPGVVRPQVQPRHPPRARLRPRGYTRAARLYADVRPRTVRREVTERARAALARGEVAEVKRVRGGLGGESASARPRVPLNVDLYMFRGNP